MALDRLRSLLRNVSHRTRVERELDDELRAYIELATEERVRRGVTRDAARRDALLEIGGVEQVKDNVRDARAGAVLDAILRDVRHSLRALRRAPALTLAV